MKMEAPQLILSAMLLLSAGICMAKYGQAKTDSYDLTDVLIGPALMFSLLWWGGFYG